LLSICTSNNKFFSLIILINIVQLGIIGLMFWRVWTMQTTITTT